MQSDDLIRDQHDISEIDENNPEEELKTPEDKDDDFIEGAEKSTDLDELHREAFGDEDKNTVSDEVNKDEVARVKDLEEEE